GTEAEELIEWAGRNCYQSWRRPNPATATNAKYIANIIGNGHESVLEHVSITFLIECSRAALAEITRHRHLSFAMESQRFVNHAGVGYVIPPAITDLDDPQFAEAVAWLENAYEATQEAYEAIEHILEEEGTYTRKQRREAARAVLPEATPTTMVVTG